MRKWWTRLGIMAASLGICAGSASAQFGPPPGGGMMGPPPGGGMMGPPPGGFGMPPGGGMAPGVMTGGPPPGAFGGGPPGAFGGAAAPAGMPPDFPNAAQPSQEPVSPFQVKDEGMPNAFTELNAPRQPPQPYALTFRGEYIGWHLTNGPINVPLVTTTTTTPSFQSFGQLGNAGTSILVNSGNTVDYGVNSGFRLTTGIAIGYLPPIEISTFYINRTVSVFSGGSLTNPTQFLALPFQDVQSAFIIPGTNVGTETASVISIPVGSTVGAQGGTVSITSQLTFWGTEANILFPINDADTLRLSIIGGYRHLQLNENLNINTATGALSAGVLFNGLAQPANVFSTTTNDFFGTTNAFDGGQFGLRGVLTFGQWSLFSDVKLGLGETTQTLSINGSSTLNQVTTGRSGPSQTTGGGIFALPTNSGTMTAREFTIVPEVNLSLSFQFTPAIRGFVGYDFLYWNRVARPGDAISGTIDSRQIPTSANFASGLTYNGPFAPAQIQQRSFIAQGIFIGMEIGF